nr:MAG TPA: hypothetical protein [Caudoviricetes sp.]
MSIIKSENKPGDMSQLDWLWLNFKEYNVQNTPSTTPSERVILTEKAITSMVQSISGGGITTLALEENPDNPETVKLIGKAVGSTILTNVVFPKEDHIVSFVNRKVTQTDIDNGCLYEVGTNALVITTKLGKTFIVSIVDTVLQLEGKESNTANTKVLNGKITTDVKIDNTNNVNSAVEIKNSSNGLYAQLKIDNSSTGVKLEVGSNGLKATALPGEATISKDEGNILTKGSDGQLYVTSAWTEVL